MGLKLMVMAQNDLDFEKITFVQNNFKVKDSDEEIQLFTANDDRFSFEQAMANNAFRPGGILGLDLRTADNYRIVLVIEILHT